ncbi:YciI family protein [Paracoccus onubensis]|uniref:YciI family protein n=1 Tax=Paracoccus onubensis TaxID=1675788 RepID=A0A418SMR8_9RHOB|nr:YciI family protein [Paracoccus onubensis]RJE82251.1 YciI family protein [Paracoccus onubensis]
MMPLFAVICRDKPGALQTRLDTREAHLAYINDTGIVAMAGPLLEQGEMRGSLVILDAADLTAAEQWAANDPYKSAGLFDSVQVTEWKKVIG